MVSFLRPYWYLGRFHSIWAVFLLVLPSYWTLAVYGVSDLKYYLVFFFVALFMRAAGCVINDIFDKDIDAAVKRTKQRPLARGDLSTAEALVFLSFLLIFPIMVFLNLNYLSKLIAILIGFLIIIYPLSKRFFSAPQLLLGIVFGSGAVLADSIVYNMVHVNTWIIYLACIIWVIAYDTVYAYQDYHDDNRLGIYSITLLLGSNHKIFVNMLYFLLFIILFVLGYIAEFGFIYYLCMLGIFILTVYPLYNLDYNKQESCLAFFRFNAYLGFLVFLTILIG